MFEPRYQISAALMRVLSEAQGHSILPPMRLAPWHMLILDHIRAHGFITSRDYAHLTDRAKPTRALDFRRLLDLGLIQRHGRGRATYYGLPERGPSDPTMV